MKQIFILLLVVLLASCNNYKSDLNGSYWVSETKSKNSKPDSISFFQDYLTYKGKISTVKYKSSEIHPYNDQLGLPMFKILSLSDSELVVKSYFNGVYITAGGAGETIRFKKSPPFTTSNTNTSSNDNSDNKLDSAAKPWSAGYNGNKTEGDGYLSATRYAFVIIKFTRTEPQPDHYKDGLKIESPDKISDFIYWSDIKEFPFWSTDVEYKFKDETEGRFRMLKKWDTDRITGRECYVFNSYAEASKELERIKY